MENDALVRFESPSGRAFYVRPSSVTMIGPNEEGGTVICHVAGAAQVGLSVDEVHERLSGTTPLEEELKKTVVQMP